MSELILHPLVQKDLRQILTYYFEEGGEKLSNRFFAEAEFMVELICSEPERFHYIDEPYRRANFKTFPYHFIYEVTLRGPRITILRHHKRHPRYGRTRR